MVNFSVQSVSLDALFRKITQLAKIAPDEVRGLDMLVDDALKRHQEEDRAKRLAAFSRVK